MRLPAPQLPLSVSAYEVGKPAEFENIIPKTYVALVCPMCGAGHAFYSTVADMGKQHV